jgi:hypothetical protein
MIGTGICYLSPMTLGMYIDGKLVDCSVLSIHKITNLQERELYIQGAVNALHEKWSDLLEDENRKLQFFIRGQFDFHKL